MLNDCSVSLTRSETQLRSEDNYTGHGTRERVPALCWRISGSNVYNLLSVDQCNNSHTNSFIRKIFEPEIQKSIRAETNNLEKKCLPYSRLRAATDIAVNASKI